MPPKSNKSSVKTDFEKKMKQKVAAAMPGADLSTPVSTFAAIRE